MWSGGICSPDAQDTQTARILVDKLKTVAEASNIKTVRAGIPMGRESMYEACGFMRDAVHLRVVLHNV